MGGEKEETVEIEEDKDLMIDQVHMIGPAPMIEQRVKIDPIAETEVVEIGKVEIKIEIKIIEIKRKIQVLGIPQTCSVTFAK